MDGVSDCRDGVHSSLRERVLSLTPKLHPPWKVDTERSRHEALEALLLQHEQQRDHCDSLELQCGGLRDQLAALQQERQQEEEAGQKLLQGLQAEVRYAC
jgi:hypothetical protein